MTNGNICLSSGLTYVMSVKRLELPESSNSAFLNENRKEPANGRFIRGSVFGSTIRNVSICVLHS